MSINLFNDLRADDEALARLHRRLEHDAATRELLDVAYRTVDSPVGTLLQPTERGISPLIIAFF